MSEPANARLRDCNDTETTGLATTTLAVRTGQRPIEGLQRSRIPWVAASDADVVRTGQRPIEGLQPPSLDADQLATQVRTGQRPIEGLQHG